MPHDPQTRPDPALGLTRRELLGRCGMGFGLIGLAGVLADDGSPFGISAARAGSPSPSTSLGPLAPRPPHFPGKAKQVVHLFMNGGPSHVDTFDPKPMLAKYHGKTLPGPNLRTERKTGAAMGSPFAFRKYGQSGIEVSELFARTAEQHIDDMCIIRSMYADVPNHEPSLDADELRRRPIAAAEHGSLDHLRPGLGEPEPARLHRDVPGRLSDRGDPELALGVPARRLPGDVHRHPAHRGRQADREHPQRRDATPPSSAGSSTWCAGSTSITPRPARTTRRSRRGSSRSSWPTACRARRPRRSTSAASPSRSARCTGPAPRPGSC